MIDERREHVVGLLGQCGSLTWLRRMASQALVACYAEPCESRLWAIVPIPTWPNKAANDEQH